MNLIEPHIFRAYYEQSEGALRRAYAQVESPAWLRTLGQLMLIMVAVVVSALVTFLVLAALSAVVRPGLRPHVASHAIADAMKPSAPHGEGP